MDAQTLCRQAAELHQRGNCGEAVELYTRALAVEPRNFAALHLLGVLKSQTGQKLEALDLIRAALAIRPEAAAAHLNHGILLEELERPGEALASYDRALALKPDFAGARFCRGNLLSQMARFEEALADYDRARMLGPPSAGLLNNRAEALRALGRVEQALASYDEALAVAPSDAAIWRNRGNLLRSENRFAEALGNYDRALALNPGDARAWDDRGAALHALERAGEALASFDRAIAMRPDCAQAWFHKALELLRAGRLGEAWPLLEWRRKLPGADATRNYPQPVWSGQDIAGKTLFVWWEEGLGDTLMYFRFCLAAKARGARVILSAPDCLTRLLAAADPGVEIVGGRAVPPHFDYHVSLLSMPLAFGTERATIPATTPYLKPEAPRVKAWAEKIGGAGFRIGIVWATTASRSLGRSFPLAAAAPLATLPGVRLISLQKHDGLAELDRLPPGMTVESHVFDEGADAFLDTAAIMENMDLIVSADTSTLHLAGALGRPAWAALKHMADWRWFEDTTSVWYPGMRLFRQRTEGGWDGVFEAMRAELART